MSKRAIILLSIAALLITAGISIMCYRKSQASAAKQSEADKAKANTAMFQIWANGNKGLNLPTDGVADTETQAAYEKYGDEFEKFTAGGIW